MRKNRRIICIVLALVMMLSVSVPSTAYAAAGTEMTVARLAADQSSSKRRTISSIDITFKNEVLYNQPLASNNLPGNLMATGSRSSIKLTWTKASNLKGLDGYIIVRTNDRNGRWYQIAAVDKNTTSYVDKGASKADKFYSYSLLGYKKVGSKIRVTPGATFWAGAVTTQSKKKNVYAVTIGNPAHSGVVRVGAKAWTQTIMIKNPCTKSIRWSSSNTKVATVNSQGIISGKRPGTATITLRLASGRTTSFKVTVIKGGTAADMVKVMQLWVGYGTRGGKHKAIIDIYNSVKPLPVGYKVKYTDQWCDTCVTAAAIKAGVADKTGRECGVERHVRLFKKLGIWNENGKITPKAGDIIVFSWYKSKQPNNEAGCHIGIVEKVENGKITTIEGNYSNSVKRRTIPVGWGYIRGYARIK